MKKKIPNLGKSGLGQNYRKAFSSIYYYLECISEGSNARTKYLAKRSFLHRKILKYEEYYSLDEYENVINESNSDQIRKLNHLVDMLNSMRGDKNFKDEELNKIVNQINSIFGVKYE